MSPPCLASGLGSLKESRTIDQSTYTCGLASVQHGGLGIVRSNLSVNVNKEKVALFCFLIKSHKLCMSHLLHFVGYKWDICTPRWTSPLAGRVASSRKAFGTGDAIMAVFGKYILSQQSSRIFANIFHFKCIFIMTLEIKDQEFFTCLHEGSLGL